MAMYMNGHKKCTKNRKSLETEQEKQEKTYFVHFCTCTFGKNLVAKQEKTYFVHFCTCTFGKNLVAKQEKTYFVHFCTCTFGKNLVAMYKNVVGPPPP